MEILSLELARRYGLWYCSSHFQTEQIRQTCKPPRPSKSQSIFLSQLIHRKHSKTSLRPSNRTAALLTDETQEFALIKVEKNPKQNKTKTFFTEEEIIRVSRCDQNIHWQHKHLDCITILCSLWCYQPNAVPGCNQAMQSQLQETAHVLLSRALNIHLHQWTLHLQAISLNIPGALWCACE